MGLWCDELYYALSIVALDSGPCFCTCVTSAVEACHYYYFTWASGVYFQASH